MAPIATVYTIVQDTAEKIGQLKLNAASSPISSTSSSAQAQAEKKVRVVDPFNYVVRCDSPSLSFPVS